MTATPNAPAMMPIHIIDPPPPPLPSSLSQQSDEEPPQVGSERDSSQSQSQELTGPAQSEQEHQPSQVGHVGPELP